MKPIVLAASLAALAALAAPAQAEPTHVMIRVQSLDAKFIGTHMGGVRIVLRDARTGALLAQGLTSGGTGDTGAIMKKPRERRAPIAGGDTAGLDAVLNIAKPTLVSAEATGPMGKPASSIKVVSSLWVIPGRDVGGDGWVLTFPGLIVEPSVRPTADGALEVAATVTLMCGCPIEPGGLWDAANYTVEAALLRGDKVVARTPLAYAGQASRFSGAIHDATPGRYVLRIVATDARTPNAGVIEQRVEIPRIR